MNLEIPKINTLHRTITNFGEMDEVEQGSAQVNSCSVDLPSPLRHTHLAFRSGGGDYCAMLTLEAEHGDYFKDLSDMVGRLNDTRNMAIEEAIKEGRYDEEVLPPHKLAWLSSGPNCEGFFNLQKVPYIAIATGTTNLDNGDSVRILGLGYYGARALKIEKDGAEFSRTIQTFRGISNLVTKAFYIRNPIEDKVRREDFENLPICLNWVL
ncbi:hypothetical protein DRJ16_03105 [Candidatus Woesearchaeota archaeon]|nr:MAG: hypothetical protein DRJ16_03105 [Candidatus Woesearchaeota archaeon]